MGEEAAKQIPDARKIVMAEADHLPQMVNPSKFNQYLPRFLRSL
jgi:pimeloyl-ACP methyl ester carboxylesterase